MEHVFASGELGIEAAAEFQKRCNSPGGLNFAGRRRKRARDDLEQGAFSRPVAAENADGFTRSYFEADIPQCPVFPVKRRRALSAEPSSESIAQSLFKAILGVGENAVAFPYVRQPDCWFGA